MMLNKILHTIFLCSLLFISNHASADIYSDIQSLVKQNKLNEALKLADEGISREQSDIKLNFIKGLILTRMDRLGDAEQVFVQLTKDNPELPEPYNNLAVVYAAQGKYNQAEDALKSAINTHPSYATAHENLGDIYAKMASRAYNQALELDTGNTTARAKLSLVNELISEPQPQSAPVAVETPKPVQQKKPVVVTEPELIVIPAKEKPKTEPPVAKADAEAAPGASAAEDELANTRQAVEDTVNDWANAWSAQDVAGYLSFYAREFIPPKNLSREAWEVDRQVRLKKPAYIKITLSNIKINIHGSEYAEVRFNQRYQSNTYGDQVRKELLMRKVDDKWLITQERVR